MKRYSLLLILIFAIRIAYSQQIDYVESVVLNTDRSNYIAGEVVHFNAVVTSKKELVSKILYVELIDPSGEQIVGMKFKINNNVSKGNFQIPDKLKTGYFYLRAYTKYMRNFSDHSFDYVQLRIINPYTSELHYEINDLTNQTSFDVDTLLNSDFFKIEIQKTNYDENEKLDVKVLNDLSDSLLNVHIAVVPKHSINYSKLKLENNNQTNNKYIPETRGVSLTGVLKDKETNELLKAKKVNLSVLEQDKNTFFSVKTDSVGQFYFALPDIYGKRDIYLSSQEIEGSIPEILVDIDFSSEKMTLPAPEFHLDKQDSVMLYNLAINKKVQDSFGKGKFEEVVYTSERDDTIPFYGEPTSTLHLDDFILLPEFEDYFNEIAFAAKIKKEKGKRKFKIFGNSAELSIYEPLVMVDLIAVNDIEEVLKASPKDILKIDVVAVPYVIGDIIYGGIINIVTRKNDLAGIKLSETGIFVNYLFLSQKYDYTLNSEHSKQLPDARNTLYWNPELTFKDKKAEFSFSTSNTPGNYTVFLTGVSATGKVYNSWIDFVVK